MGITMKLSAIAAVAAVAAMAGGAASAASYTFDFTDSKYSTADDKPDNNSSITISSVEDKDVTVTLSASYFKLSSRQLNPYGEADVDFNSYGIISQNDHESGSPDHAIDSWGKDEAIIFDFGMDVILADVDLSWHYGATYNKYGHKIGYATPHWDLFIGEAFEGRYSGDEGVDVAGSSFAIGTSTKFFSDGSYRQSAIKIRSITIEKLPVSEVPLPAAGWMLVAGLGGLVAAKRRKA